jgi:hypothetical protein
MKAFHEQIIPLDFRQDAQKVPYTPCKILYQINEVKCSYKDRHVHERLSQVQFQPYEQHPAMTMLQI